jgi:hypothetical protein
MPLGNAVELDDNRNIDHCAQVLRDFKEKIEQCLADEDWEQLPVILGFRQAYLERILNQSIPEQRLGSIKKLVQTLLEDDACFIAQVEEHKSGLFKQQQSLERGVRATQAYKNN